MSIKNETLANFSKLGEYYNCGFCMEIDISIFPFINQNEHKVWFSAKNTTATNTSENKKCRESKFI